MESKRGNKTKIEGVKKINSDPQSMTYKTKFKKERDLQNQNQKNLKK
jgi:hypothetical protein